MNLSPGFGRIFYCDAFRGISNIISALFFRKGLRSEMVGSEFEVSAMTRGNWEDFDSFLMDFFVGFCGLEWMRREIKTLKKIAGYYSGD